jgi:fluoride exporter
MPGREFFMLMRYFLVAVGGALGSVSRYWVDGLISEHFGREFPWGTVLINITGSFLIGLFFGVTGFEGRWLAHPNTRAFLMIGICGGYTTFSSFSLQTLTLAQNGQWLRAGMNVVLSVILCLIAVWLGYALAMKLNSMKGS